jgi:hypothetical protein
MKIAPSFDKARKSAGFSGASQADPDIIFITDRQAWVVYCSPRMEYLYFLLS